MTNELITVDNVQVLNVTRESEVLQGKTRVGEFVHNGQTMSGDVDFRNVSRLWYDKTMSFEQGRELMNEQRKEREDLMIAAGDVEFTADEKGLIVKLDDREFRPTEHAIKSLCTWFHAPQTVATYYLNPPNSGKYKRDQSDHDVVAYCLENGQRRVSPEKELLFRTYQDGTLRGVMSDQYSIVNCDWYLDILSKIIPGGRLSHWKGDADTIYGNVIIPDSIREDSDSEYGGMLSLSNCEIGKRKISQRPSIFYAICMNGCIWDQEKGIAFSQRHKGINLDDLAANIQANIQKQIPLLTVGCDLLLATKMWKLTTAATNIFAAIQREAKITPALANEIAVEFGNQGMRRDAFGIIDAITRTSQRQDAESYVGLDSFAGQLIQPKNWARIEHIAKGLDEKEVKKALNLAL